MIKKTFCPAHFLILYSCRPIDVLVLALLHCWISMIGGVCAGVHYAANLVAADKTIGNWSFFD